MPDLPEPQELEFRDGYRLVPEYLAAIMADLDTYKMTFEEAVAAANKRLEANFLNAKQDDVLAAHFRRGMF